MERARGSAAVDPVLERRAGEERARVARDHGRDARERLLGRPSDVRERDDILPGGERKDEEQRRLGDRVSVDASAARVCTTTSSQPVPQNITRIATRRSYHRPPRSGRRRAADAEGTRTPGPHQVSFRMTLHIAHLAVAAASITLLAACSDDADDPAPATTTTTTTTTSADVDILEALQAIEGLEVQEKPAAHDGYRFFRLQYEQPADHDDPEGPRFMQRMTLLHREVTAPFVIESNGYFISPLFQFLNEPAELLGANQLLVEHRFFTPSRPEPADWSKLTIEQAAADHHRIIEALRPLYHGKWVSTGGSKGGMTSVYHRRFYPDDVDATVAYVAPQSYGTSDPRYLDFLAQVGDAACRQALKDAQREALLRRPAMIERMQEQAAEEHVAYDLLGTDRALEVAVLELPFTFWQYQDASLCAEVPTAASTDDEVWAFLDQVDPPLFWADEELITFEPYYFQAAVQLGYPAVDEANVADLMMYPGLDVPSSFIVPGPGKDTVFDPGAMTDVADWLATEGESMLFLYGENDPYSAAAFELGGAKDSFRFFVPEGNHGSEILDLPAADRDAALEALEAWTFVTPVVPDQRAPMSLRRAMRRHPL